MVVVYDLISSSESEAEEEEVVPVAVNENIPPHMVSKRVREEEPKYYKDKQTGDYVFPASMHSLPSALGDALYSYQREGVAFILEKWHSKPCHGCLLADDMGMGKTLQSIAALTSLFYTAKRKKEMYALVVVPLAVMAQWQYALEKQFAKIECFHGPQKQRALDRFLSSGGVLLSTYDTVSTEANLCVLQNVKWECLVIDEATKIKNHKTGFFKSLRALADCAKYRLALSATPFENNLGEMWCLFDFACAGKLLGKRVDFEHHFASRIEKAQDAVLSAKLSKALHDVIHPFMLRREKSLFKQQPQRQEDVPVFDVNKVDCVVWVTLSPHQRTTYESFLESQEVKDVLNYTKSPLAAITVLRKICDDTRLLPELCTQQQNQRSTSNKMRCLIALLKDLCLEKQHKTVVFCNSKRMLDLMEAEVDRHLGNHHVFAHLRVDGDVKKEDRVRIINAFNRDEPLLSVGGEEGDKHWDCLFLTTGVGALGIEITGADRVILFQPHWNPAQDDQAVDRCFRLGQKNNVVCFRLITVGTVEEKMCDIQLRKSSLAKNVLQANKGSSYACKLNIANLFTLEEEMDDDEEDELFAGNWKRNRAEVRRLLNANQRDCEELLSQLQALTCGNGESSLLVDLYEKRIVLSASERSTLFQENTHEIALGMQQMTAEEKRGMEDAMESALGWVGGTATEEEEEEL